jgi:hypothetical protein
MMARLKQDESGKLIVLLAIIFGGWLRFMPAVLAGFPINDGGLFYTMIDDLYAHHFVLPAFTSYNSASIPFAYPPLAFYIAGILKAAGGFSTTSILLWVSPVVTTTSILAFFFLARQFFPDSWLKAALATTAFALLPRSYSWFVMGGGITRAFGQLFMLLMLGSVAHLYTQRTKTDIWLSGILGALTVLSHPEATIHAIVACLLFWLFLSRSRRGLVDSLWIAGIVLIGSAPWWASVLIQHGTAPFLSASQTGGNWTTGLIKGLSFSFGEEKLASVITVLGMIGLGIAIAKKSYLLPVWLIVPFLVQPRSATAVAIYPLAMLAAIALGDMILPTLARFRHPDEEASNPISVRFIQIFLGLLMMYLVLSSFLYDMQLAQGALPAESRTAFAWVKGNTSPASRFIVLSGEGDPMVQAAGEWFPALAERRSELTLQGREWIGGVEFTQAIQPYSEVQACLFSGLTCLNEKLANLDITYDYIFIQKPSSSTYDQSSSEDWGLPLAIELSSSPDYQLVYKNEGVLIYKMIPLLLPPVYTPERLDTRSSSTSNLLGGTLLEMQNRTEIIMSMKKLSFSNIRLQLTFVSNV